MMSRQLLHTIDENDLHLQPLYIRSAIGHIQPIDVGKRVYDVDGIVQVENAEQRDKRQAEGGAT